jgi:tRNA-modifying protein YgfZ
MSDGNWLAPVQPDVVWFSGGDALRFLNDIISQEIGDLSSGDSRRSFLLEPQGKLRFLLWVIRDGDRYGLITEDGRGAELATALGRYRIRVDVEITEAAGGAWIVVGEWDGYDVSWPGVERSLVIGDPPDLPEMPEAEYEQLRVSAGEPRWGVDVDDSTIPHESGLVPTSVDFTKGCFLGQELVARIDSRGGNTPRHLRHLRTDHAISPGEVVTVDGEEVGVVSSAAGGVALAMLKRSVSVGDSVEVAGARALVEDLPSKTQG